MLQVIHLIRCLFFLVFTSILLSDVSAQDVVINRITEVETAGELVNGKTPSATAVIKEKVTFYSNIEQDVLFIDINSDKKERVLLSLKNSLSETVETILSSLTVGRNILSVDIKKLLPGTYLLNVLGTDWRYFDKVTKK